jgi:T5SS/PEP-CTERM-associated repeat protein
LFSREKKMLTSNRRRAAASFRCLSCALPVAGALDLLICQSSRAASRTWNTGSGNWSVSTNWNPNGVPVTGDDAKVLLNIGGAVNYDYTGAAVTLNSLTLDIVQIIGGTLNFSMGANQLHATIESVAASTGTTVTSTALFSQSGGTNTVGTLIMGANSNDQGSYNLSGAASLLTGAAATEYVGQSGQGTFTQSNGSNAPVNLYLGLNPGSSGTYTMTGAGSTLNSGAYEAVGARGTGSFTQNGGTNIVGATSTFAENLDIGASAGSTGTYILNGGTLNVMMGSAPGYEDVGRFGAGSFIQNGGTHTAGTLTVGDVIGSQGNFTLAGGSLVTTSSQLIGASGTAIFTQTGGSNSPGTLDIGFATGGNGTYNLGGTGSLSVANQENIGFQGAATFNQTGGRNTAAFSLSLGALGGSSGTYNLGGTATLLVTGGGEAVGSSGVGFFNQSGGAVSISPGNTLTIGNASGSTGTYNLSGSGTLTCNGTEYVGFGGTGSFNQGGGTNMALNGLIVGENAGATGSYTLSGGTLTVSGNDAEFIGDFGAGNFVQTGGTHNTIVLYLAAEGAAAVGAYNLSGTGALNATSAEIIGESNTGTFTQSAGVNTTNNLDLGGQSGSSGTYNLNGGTLLVGNNVVGNGVFVGAAATGKGVLTVSGAGLMTVFGALTINNNALGSAVNLSGGTINAAALNFNGAPSLFNWTSGTLNLTTSVTFDSGATATSTSAAFGPSLALGVGQTLMVTGDETLGGAGSFALTLNSGATHYVSGTLTLNPAGTITQNAGSSLYAATFTQAGGTVNGTLQNQGNFIYQSGLFNGRLLNQGTVNTGPLFTAANGVENDAAMTVSTGQTLVANGQGLDNLGVFTLAGGILSGNGPAVNDFGGTMLADGAINPAFTNDGRLTATGTLRFNGGASNFGILQGSGTIIGAVTNNAGGLIAPSITNNLATLALTSFQGNSLGASIAVDAGLQLNISNAWSNAGGVTLSGVAGSSAVLGGNTITNTGTIQGAGLVSAKVLNSGTVRASGGELDLGGSGGTNAAAGQIQATTGNTVLYLAGLASNAGNIALQGGTFDNNNSPITNSGAVTGFGTFRSGALTNNGTITLTGGLSFVSSSSLTNSAGGAIAVQFNPAVFTGLVTNNGTFKVVSTTASFGGGFTGNPQSPSALPGAIAPAIGGLDGAGATAVDAAGVIQSSYVRQGSLTDAGQVLLRTSATGGALSTLTSLSITGAGKFDLADNDLIVNYIGAAPLGGVRAALLSGYDQGKWDGNGLSSVSAAADSAHLTALGYADASDVGITAFDGQPVSTAVLIKYTYYGDSSLDGKVDLGNDFNLFLQGFIAASASSWVLGDYNYDGVTNTADFQLFLDSFKTQNGSLGALDQFITQSPLLSITQKSTFLSAVPEPSSVLALLTATAILKATRRRRRRQ